MKLVMAEKPSAANDYAKALGCKEKKDGYIEGNNYIVTWAYGHLFSLEEPGEYNEKFKKWELEDLPIIPEKFNIKLINGAGKQFKIIKNLINRPDVDMIINGGDPGREGELIQRYILMAAGNKKPVKRLWINTLTESEIKKAFENLKSSEQYDSLYYAATARNEIDWLIGMNYTRAYTLKKGKGVVLSIGRCQTPMLNMIAQRDDEIKKFVSVPYYEIEAQFNDYKGKYINNETSRIDTKQEAEEIKKFISDKTGTIIKLETESKNTPPPQLYNLTNLQKIMNKKYGFSAQKTLDIAQELYEKHKILSYPRTSSRYLSTGLVSEFPNRLNILSFGDFKSFVDKLDKDNLKVTKRFVDDSKLSDHYALIPTDNQDIGKIYKELDEDEKHEFDEVVLSFIVCFYPDYEYESTTIITNIEKYDFKTTGKKEIQKGWKEIYQNADQDSEEEQNISNVNVMKGKKENVLGTEIKNKKTEPPKKFTEATLLTQLEKYGIGTEATRAGIIETLIKREFIIRQSENKKQHLVSTQLGKDLLNTIETKELKSVELTSELEKKLEGIAEGKVKKSEVINEMVNTLKSNVKAVLESKGEQIGIHRQVLGQCPFCHEGQITENKSGYGCSKYKENNCNFFIRKEIQGKKIAPEQVKKLVQTGKTDIIQGFKTKNGEKTFDAALIIEDKAIKFKFTSDEDLYQCPACKKGKIRSGRKGYYCSEYKNGCKLFIAYEIAGKKLTTSQVKKLIEKGKTDIIKGFKNKNGDEFEAALIIKDGIVKFETKKK